MQPAHVGEAGPDLDRLEGGGVGNRRAFDEHVLRQRDHHGAGAAIAGHVKGVGDDFRDARGIVDFRRPFGHGAEHRAIIELLECLAPAHGARHLADENDERRRILLGDVDAGGRIGGAGPAGDKTDAGTAGGLALRFGGHRRAALVAADGELYVAVVEGVERGKIAFPRHAKGVAHTVNDELIHQDLATAAHIVLAVHCQLRSAGVRKRVLTAG